MFTSQSSFHTIRRVSPRGKFHVVPGPSRMDAPRDHLFMLWLLKGKACRIFTSSPKGTTTRDDLVPRARVQILLAHHEQCMHEDVISSRGRTQKAKLLISRAEPPIPLLDSTLRQLTRTVDQSGSSLRTTEAEHQSDSC